MFFMWLCSHLIKHMCFFFSLGFVVLLQCSLPIVFWMDKPIFMCIFINLGYVFSFILLSPCFFLSLNDIKCCNDK